MYCRFGRQRSEILLGSQPSHDSTDSTLYSPHLTVIRDKFSRAASIDVGQLKTLQLTTSVNNIAGTRHVDSAVSGQYNSEEGLAGSTNDLVSVIPLSKVDVSVRDSAEDVTHDTADTENLQLSVIHQVSSLLMKYHIYQ